MATGDFTQTDHWNPKLPSDDSQYSSSSVNQTRSGHVFEVDDTLGNERIGEHHKSGTSRVITADGSSDITIVGDAWITIIRDGHILINGEVNVTMAKTVKLHCKKLELEVEGDMNTTVHGSYNLKVDGNYAVEVVHDMSEKIAGNKITECKDLTHTVHGKVSETISAGYTGVVGGNYSMSASGSAGLTGGFLGATLNSMGQTSVGGSLVGISSLLTTVAGTGGILIQAPEVLLEEVLLVSGPTTYFEGLDFMSTITGPVPLSLHVHEATTEFAPTLIPMV